MHDAHLVAVVEGIGDLRDEPQGLLNGQGAFSADKFAEGAAT